MQMRRSTAKMMMMVALAASCAVAMTTHARAAEPMPTCRPSERAPQLTTARLAVEGVRCAQCSLRVRRAVASIDGVAEVRAGASKGEVVVAFDASRVDVDALVGAIRRAGFGARVIKVA